MLSRRIWIAAILVFLTSTALMFFAFRPPFNTESPGGFSQGMAVTGYFGVVVAGLILLIAWARSPLPKMDNPVPAKSQNDPG